MTGARQNHKHAAPREHTAPPSRPLRPVSPKLGRISRYLSDFIIYNTVRILGLCFRSYLWSGPRPGGLALRLRDSWGN
jgi:hypothetical protein